MTGFESPTVLPAQEPELSMPVTAAEVREIRFNQAGLLVRGYNAREVDAFLDRIANTLDGNDSVTSADVHRIAFGRAYIGGRGYDEAEVDAFLRLVESTLAQRVHDAIRSSAPYVAPALEHTHARRALWWRKERG